MLTKALEDSTFPDICSKTQLDHSAFNRYFETRDDMLREYKNQVP